MSCSSTQKTRFQLRRATEAQWAASGVTLLPGEPAVSTDTKQIKIGTGALWSQTDYINLAGGVGTVGTPTTLATLIVLTPSSKSGTTIILSSQATLSQNQAVAFNSAVGNLVLNTIYYVFASVTNSNSVQVKTSITGSSAY
jgi:hypothetical protein